MIILFIIPIISIIEIIVIKFLLLTIKLKQLSMNKSTKRQGINGNCLMLVAIGIKPMNQSEHWFEEAIQRGASPKDQDF